MEIYLGIFASLFSVINPLGAIPVFLALTPDESKTERLRIVRSTSAYVVLILISFFLAGSLILHFFGVSLNAIRIAGGIVIMTSGFALLNGKFAESRAINKKVKKEALEKDDISFAPMAMPMLSGPGSISLLIGYYSQYSELVDRAAIAGIIVLIGVVIYAILRAAPFLNRVLGVAGLKAVSRIMGFIVMAIGIQYIITGIVALVVDVV